MKRPELGVFLPVAKNGFVRSTNSPAYEPSFRDNLEIAQLAEQIGLDYVFSMLKWKGVGGATRFWDSSFESFSLMAGLAAVTERVRLIATVNPLLFHPAVMAKMAATIDDVSGGRLGLNIVTGATLGEYSQMGVLPEGYDRTRYAYATEWTQVLKRLWTETAVTHHGEHFHLEACVSEPKPVQKPHPFLVCAAASEEGMRFTAREADYCFVNGQDVDSLAEKSTAARRIAAEEGRSIKIAATVMLVIRDSLAEAEAYWDHLLAGADVEALQTSGARLSAETREGARRYGAERLATLRIHSGLLIMGGPEQIADELAALAERAVLDSLVICFPDYVDGLWRLGEAILPVLA